MSTYRTVTATDLARNFSDFLNQVRYQGVILDVRRGSDIVARVTPAQGGAGFPTADLDALLASLPTLTEAEADDFLADVRTGRVVLSNSGDAWEA